LFALNGSLESSEKYLIYKFNVRKSVCWKAKINKEINILEKNEYLQNLYNHYMVRVLDMTKDEKVLILQGIKIGAAFGQICHDYGVYLLEGCHNQSIKEQNTSKSRSIESHIINEPRAGNFALDVKISNKDTWMSDYIKVVGTSKYLCLPLNSISKETTTLGQVFITVKALKDTESVNSITEFEEGVDSYVDNDFILLKNTDLANLAIMFDVDI
jgi:hypothetical protein